MKSLRIILISALFFSTIPVFASTYGVQTKTSHCIASVLPDTACSPGAVLTTNIKTICTVGYTKTVRSVSTATKKKVFTEYDISYSKRSNYEVDHIISLELGGSNDISNLFPEAYSIKNGARIKDVFENYLHKQVCNGSMTIDEAQKEISTNWLTYNTTRLNSTKTTITTPSTPTPSKAETIAPQVVIPQVNNPTSTAEPAVKKSTTGICHAKGTSYYARTTNYITYTSIANCLSSGGRLPAK